MALIVKLRTGGVGGADDLLGPTGPRSLPTQCTVIAVCTIALCANTQSVLNVAAVAAARRTLLGIHIPSDAARTSSCIQSPW